MESETVKKILLCDDSMLHRKLIIAMLHGLPYDILEATTGQEAERYALTAHDSIDLILLDIGMRDISGIEVCKAIRSSDQDRRRPLPIIAYTAHAMVDERKQYLSNGFNDILTKPTMREDLFSILHRHLLVS